MGSLLAKVAQRPGAYRRAIISTAFLDTLGVRLLERIVHRTDRRSVQVVICLGPSAYKSASELIRCQSRLVRNLHSKVYALEGRRAAEDDLIVTSANLTASGLKSNHETGIRMWGSASRVRQMIKQVRRHIDKRPKISSKSKKNQGPFKTAMHSNTNGAGQL